MALIDNINLYKKLVIEVDEPITDIITCVQEDADSRYLDVQLFKSGVSFDLSGTKVRIYMVKPDGTNIMNDGEITDAVSGRCQFLLTTQALAACGILKTQIKVFSETEEQILSTQIFKIDVTESLLTNKTIESTNEYGSLVILFQDIYEALQVMTAIKNNFGEPGETAQLIQVETFWQMLEAVYNVNADALKEASISEVIKKLERYGGRVRAYDGRIFAAVIEEVVEPLKTVLIGNSSFEGTYNGVAYDTQYFYVSTNSHLYKVNRGTLAIEKTSDLVEVVFSCDENYLYAGNYQIVKKLDKNTFAQVAQSDFNPKYAGAYDCNFLMGNYVFNTNANGTQYTKLDKNSFGVIDEVQIGSGGKGRISGNSKFIICSPSNVNRIDMSKLDNYSEFAGSLDSASIMSILCDSNHAYVLGISKLQKFEIETMQLVAEVNAPVSVSDGTNFDCQNDNFLFLVQSGGGKIKKISKTTLEVIAESAENFSKIFFADNEYIYCVTSDNLPSKVSVVSDSNMSSIAGFKEV